MKATTGRTRRACFAGSLTLGVFVLAVAAAPAFAQSILNGDFEDNTSVGCDFNLSNAEYTARMADSTAFGAAQEICIMAGQCRFSSPPQSGTTKIGIATRNVASLVVDAFSLTLSSPLVAGDRYELCFHAEANTEFSDGSISDIQVGESTSATSFGSFIFSATANTSGWTQFCEVFVASIDATHITVRNTQGVRGWNHLDNFTLVPANAPPDCSTAAADPDQLWRPSHGFVDVLVVGVTDPDGDPVLITIDSIHQDEAPWALSAGAGSTMPDALGLGTDVASVRAERNGNPNTPGDGRVYHIAFTAEDDQGGSCSDTVTVCVPHDQGGEAGCVDGGPLFDSTLGPACGIGFELVFVLPPWLWLRQRVRRGPRG